MSTRPRKITQEQWDKLKAGDILISPRGIERKILERDGPVITLAPINNWRTKKKHVVLGKCDIWNTYRVKNGIYLGAIVPKKSIEFCAQQFIRAVILEKPEAELNSEYMLSEFATELRKYLVFS